MTIRFGPFELDEERFELRREGRVIRVRRRVFDTIRLLAENCHRVVSKAELINGPWGGSSVTDAALWRTIMLVRQALGDDPKNPRVVVTVRGRGVRLLTPTAESSQQKEPSELALAAGAGPSAQPFFGRLKELAVLEDAFTSARVGRGKLVFVVGEPGIGKTALVERFVGLPPGAKDAFWGRSREAGGAPSFWPWSEALRSLSESQGRSVLRMLTMGLGTDLTRIVPEFRQLLPGDDTSAELDQTPQARFRVFDSVSTYLKRSAAREPLLLVLEDLHAADDAAVALLSFIATTMAESPLLIVATCRAPDFNERPGLRALLRSAQPPISCLTLEGLAEHEITEWLSHSAAGPLNPRAPANVLRSTNGHPFLVQDLIRTVGTHALGEHTEHLHRKTPAIPDSLAGSLRSRLSRLPQETRTLLDRASVMGREFPATRVANGSFIETLRLIEPACREGLVEASTRHSGWLRFTHDLVRKTIYGDLPENVRLEMHVQLADTLAHESPADSVFEISHHLLMAAPLADPNTVVEWALRAMDQADRQVAHELSAEYGQRTIEAIEIHGNQDERLGPVLLSTGKAQSFARQTSAADSTLKRCFEWGLKHEAPDIFVRALMARIELIREHATVDSDLRDQIAAALRQAPAEPALRSQLLAAQAVSGFFSATAAETRALFRSALQTARDSGDAEALMATGAIVSLANRYTLSALEIVNISIEMMSAARRMRRADRMMEVLIMRASCLLELGDGAQFRAVQAEHHRIALELRYPIELWHSTLLDATSAALDGDLATSEAIARRAQELAAPQVGLIARGYLGAQLLCLALEKPPGTASSDLAYVIAAGKEILATAPGYQVWTIGIAMAELELGSAKNARDCLSKLAGSSLSSLTDDVNRLFCLTGLARLARNLGDAAVARELVEHMWPLAGQHAANCTLYFGPINHYLGQLALMLGDVQLAAERFEAAMADAERVGSKPWKAWSEQGVAEALSKSPRVEDRQRCDELQRSARRQALAMNLGRLLHVLDTQNR